MGKVAQFWVETRERETPVYGVCGLSVLPLVFPWAQTLRFEQHR